MIIIEFFGPSGSGKSHFKERLVKKFSFKVLNYKTIYNLISDRSIISKLFYNIVKLPYLQRIKNFFFIKSVKKIFFGIIETKKIENNKNFNKERELKKKINLIKELIAKSEFKDKKKILENWASEEIYVNHNAKKITHQKILIDSEGLIQRLFIYCYNKKNKKIIIRKYLNLIEMPEIIIFFEKKRINKKNDFMINQKEEKNIFNLTIKELRKKNILIINSKIGTNKSYFKIKKKLKL